MESPIAEFIIRQIASAWDALTLEGALQCGAMHPRGTAGFACVLPAYLALLIGLLDQALPGRIHLKDSAACQLPLASTRLLA